MADYPLATAPRVPSNNDIINQKNLRVKHIGTDIFETNVRNLMTELGDLLIRKHHDYGPTNISDSPYGPIPGLVTRIWDKLARIRNLTQNSSTPNNESLEDSFADTANYAIIGMLVLRGQWDVEH
jgi:hypothetical protein